MPWTQNHVDWVAARLLPAIYDINQQIRYDRNIKRLTNLLREVDTPEMNIRLRELAELREGQIIHPAPAEPNSPSTANSVTSNNKIQINRTNMGITGLQSGAFQGALTQLKQRMVDKQNSAVASITAGITAGEAKIDAAVKGVTDKIDAEVSDALQEFATFTNGAPA